MAMKAAASLADTEFTTQPAPQGRYLSIYANVVFSEVPGLAPPWKHDAPSLDLADMGGRSPSGSRHRERPHQGGASRRTDTEREVRRRRLRGRSAGHGEPPRVAP